MKPGDIRRAMEDAGPEGVIRAFLRWLDEECHTFEEKYDLVMSFAAGLKAQSLAEAARVVRAQEGAFDPEAVAGVLEEMARKVCDTEAAKKRLQELEEE